MATPSAATKWRGHEVVDAEESKIGKIEGLYVDEESGLPEWAEVKTGPMGIGSNTLVPLTNARIDDDEVVHLTFDKKTIKGAPQVDTSDGLSSEEEQRLFEHYGFAYQRPTGPERAEMQARLHPYEEERR